MLHYGGNRQQIYPQLSYSPIRGPLQSRKLVLNFGIISRSELIGLFSNGTDNNPHDWTTVLHKTPSKLGQLLKSLRKGTDILHAMCAELAGAQGLLEPETPVIPRFGSREDGGLVAVNHEILQSLRASGSPLLREDTVSDDPFNTLNALQ